MSYNISMKKPADNFFLSYWRGELGLGASFWGIFVFLSILVTGLLGISMDYIPKQISFSLMTAFMIYTCVGLYQSNIKHGGLPSYGSPNANGKKDSKFALP